MLGQIPGFVHVSAHEVFGSLPLEQEASRMCDDDSSHAQNTLNLVTVEMLHYHLRMLTKQGRLRPEIDTVVLDGIPTNAVQAEAIRSFINVRLVLNLWLPSYDELRRRIREHAMAHGRVDETSDTAMRARLRRYVNKAMALVEYYRSVTRVVITMAEPMKVFRDILRMIKDVDGERLARAADNESAAPRFIEAFQSTSSEGVGFVPNLVNVHPGGNLSRSVISKVVQASRTAYASRRPPSSTDCIGAGQSLLAGGCGLYESADRGRIMPTRRRGILPLRVSGCGRGAFCRFARCTCERSSTRR